MNSDHVGPFEPPPSPRPGDLGPPAPGYTRGVKATALPIPALDTIVAITNSGLLTTYLQVCSKRESGPGFWSMFACRHGAKRGDFNIDCDAGGFITVIGRGGRTFFRGKPTHAPAASLELSRDLPEAGCVFYDLEGE